MTIMDRRDILQHALVGIEHQRRELAALARSITEEIMGTAPNPADNHKVVETVHHNGIKPKYKRSEEVRKRMSEAQSLRWKKAKRVA